MADRKVLQVSLPEDCRGVIDLMLGVTKTKPSTLVRSLLLRWVAETLDYPGAVRGGRCAKLANGNCESSGAGKAVWYLTTWRSFICAECAQASPSGLAVLATDQHQPALNLEAMRSAIEQLASKHEKVEKTDDELWEEAVRAMAALQARRIGASSFEALVERFKLD